MSNGDSQGSQGALQDQRVAQPAPWPGDIIIVLMLVGLLWPLVPIAAALPAYLFADRDQAFALAAVGAALFLLGLSLGG